MAHQDSGRTALPTAAGDGAEPGRQASPGGPGGWPGRLRSPWLVKNWRIRWRVLALVIIPSVAAIVLGVLRTQVAQDTSDAAARTSQLGALGADITSLAESIQDERDLTAGYVATRLAGDNPAETSIFAQLQGQYRVTSARLATVQRLAGAIGPAYPATARADLSLALSSLSALPELRTLAHSEMSPLPLTDHYSAVVATLLAFDSDLAGGSSSAQLAQTVTSVEALAQTEEEVSQQRAILYAALLEGQFEPGALSALVAAQSSQASDLATFQQNATSLPAFVPPSGLSPVLTEAQQFNNAATGPSVDAAQATELDAIVVADNGQRLAGNLPQAWFNDMSSTLSAMRSVENDNLASVVSQANTLQQGAENSEELTAAAVAGLLLLVLLVTILMARSMIGPLRKLRADALDVAGHRLPDVVRRLGESQEGGESIHIEPIGINSTDEIGEVARAFDRVHSEAVRLASDEAMIRANLNAMFVNLSRRSQTLIERQLGIIDTLEQSEQDPDRLSSLFRLDHLATRMRRNSENLLVLAGHEAPRKWTQPVPLVDVLRAAISEIEQYERISLNVQPGIVIAGRAASDVVHLAAELLENATTFSSEETQVHVSGQLLTSGGVLVEITDQGLGIPEEELQYANWRLDNPPVIDVAVSRRMGLFVVGRLAARHGIRVRLRHATAAGLSALIWLPGLVAEPETAPPLGMLRRGFDTDGYAFSGQVSVPPVPAVHSNGGTGGVQVPVGAGVPTPAAPVQAAPVRRPVTPVRRSPAGEQSTPAGPVGPGAPGAPGAPGSPGEPGEPEFAPAANGDQGQRLPIYDAVESDWFRRSGTHIGPSNGTPASSWTSPADEGFRAARAVVSPTAGEMTQAGLPRRVPAANLIPGSVGGGPAYRQAEGPTATAPSATPAARRASSRSPEEVRARLAEFQRGARQGRSDAPWDFGASENS